MLITFLKIIHIIISLLIILIVLVQEGSGQGLGSGFGGAASDKLFSSAGGKNFLTRATTVLVVLFVVTTIGISKISSSKKENKSQLKEKMKTEKNVESENINEQKNEDSKPVNEKSE